MAIAQTECTCQEIEDDPESHLAGTYYTPHCNRHLYQRPLTALQGQIPQDPEDRRGRRPQSY